MTEIQALLLIKSILESADIHGIESFLAEDCEYMSTGRALLVAIAMKRLSSCHLWLSPSRQTMCLLHVR